MSSSVSGVTSSIGLGIAGGPGEAKSVIEGTLYENRKMAAWYQAPLRIPDALRLLPTLGGNINITV
jgi:hypothetical protein